MGIGGVRMQDRFKFRVWSIANKKYCHFLTVDLSADGLLRVIRPLEQSEYIDDYENRYVIQQCTGLKDKNGKLIYEGDIVKFKPEIFGRPKQIIWNECHYILKDTFIILCDMEIKKFGLEVIGNIYENPELLEY